MTAHLTLPRQDFDRAIAALAAKGITDAKFFWLPWSSLGKVLQSEVAVEGEPYSRAALDLLRYLNEAEVLRFLGWSERWTLASTNDRWHYDTRAPAPYWNSIQRGVGTWQYERSAVPYFIGGLAPWISTTPLWSYLGRTA